jgi:hypothetical protein
MKEILIGLLIVVIILLGPNAPSKIYHWVSRIFQKIRLKKSDRFIVTITRKNDPSIHITNILGTLNENTVNFIAQNRNNLFSEGVSYNYTDKEQAYIEKSSNKNLVIFAVNTYNAYSSGLMQKIFPTDQQEEMPSIDEFVSEFNSNSTWRQGEILDLNDQMKEFFHSVVPMEGEAIIGFAERQILTTHRFVIMSASKIPIVEQSIPLAEINNYKIEKYEPVPDSTN